ncbi:MAG: 2-succinyl-5-enolpyruvyl-6-hydroxy-3-cyclohexene-1-carboxylic-acid synthase [Crocinitomicaceae bacterium]|nr:2-succinyl-5-enolpyruvyl-6-hydroxy-3-cyclohexene-1-carboxylic-acid synthase [Crocinitomicaceae bacterium]
MITTDKTGVSALIKHCLSYGMTHFVCSPGSRNAPIVIALDEHPDVRTIIIHDERSAGFYALGMAQQLQAPVGLVCTSGSAMLNYYPAVAEAYYQCVPLVVLSADRPEEWVNHGDGQTIVQKGVYQNHIQYEYTVPEFINDTGLTVFNSNVSNAFDAALVGWQGPIHFNIPLSEPLYNSLEVDYQPAELVEFGDLEEADLKLDEFSELWKSSERKMIICGQLERDDALNTNLAEIAKDTSVAVLVENTSNLTDGNFIQCIDRTLGSINENEIEQYRPEVIVTLGRAVVSKRIKKFLRESNLRSHWKIGFDFPEMDTYRALSNSIKVAPNTFVYRVLKQIGILNNSTFGNRWKQNDYLVQDKLVGYFDDIPYSDLSVFETVLDYLPENSLLHMGNSSVVRYCQLFDPIKSIHYFSNRGTSGIDGSLSTACGASVIVKDKYNVMITGDVSFFYDSNALWSNYLGENLRIILINNSGGGIFKIIEGPSRTHQLEKYFVTEQKTKAKDLCKAFGVKYFNATSIEGIEAQMDDFYNTEDKQGAKLIEIETPNGINDIVLKEFFKYLKIKR